MKSSHLSLLQISDLHILPTSDDKLLGVTTEHYFHAILNHAFQQPIAYDLLLVTGDLAQSPCKESYTRILKTLEQHNLPARCLAGNHDDFSLMQQILNTDLINCCRQTVLGNWQILTLNSQIPKSEAGGLATAELDFLAAMLEKHSDLFTVIAFHHNCLPTESAWLDTMTIENSEAFLEIVTRYQNVKVVTTGHIHQEMHKTYKDILVLGTPSTCFQFSPNSFDFSMDRTPPGYRVLELYDDGKVVTHVHRLDTPLYELELDVAGY